MALGAGVNGHDIAVETLANHTDMTQREAEAYVWRELRNVSRSEAARQMDVSENTLDNHLQAARKKAALPPIDAVKRMYPSDDGRYGTGYEIRFANGAMLRYIWDNEREEIREETFQAHDADTVFESLGVGGTEDDVAGVALESIIEYTQTYRDDLTAARQDWSHIVEAILCWA